MLHAGNLIKPSGQSQCRNVKIGAAPILKVWLEAWCQARSRRRGLGSPCSKHIGKKSLPRPWTPRRRRARYPKGTLRTFSVNSRTGLRRAEMEIEKWRPETGAQNPLRTDRNTENRQPETGAPQPNLRNVGDSPPPGNNTAETGLRGANRIRTKACTCIICIAFNRRKTRAKSRRAR
jgi:hypothetical protein